MNTKEMVRTWALLSTRERVSLVVRMLGASGFGAALPAGTTWAFESLHDAHGWLRVGLLVVAIGVGAFGAMWLYLARAGRKEWRRGW